MDFGAPPPEEAPERTLTADDRIEARWEAEIARANKARSLSLAMPSPIGVMAEVMRMRTMPAMPWPAQWSELARRCRTYPGDMIGVVGGTGSGKTQWAIQVARSFAAAGRGCVLWNPQELRPAIVGLRIAANLTGTHAAEIREEWTEQRIRNALATVTDRWRFVDVVDGEAQLAVFDAALEIAERIYGAPPLLIIDYAQLMAEGDDTRQAMAAAIRGVGKMTERRGCYTIALSQTSRGNAPALAGKSDVASSTDLVGTAAESSAFERWARNVVNLIVFKADDQPTLDAHWHVSKSGWAGAEGPTGARYQKAGGVWTELDHLPATPLETEAEVKRGKKTEGGPKTANEARVTLNTARSDEAANKRREAVIAALRNAGSAGMGTRDLRRVKGSGSAARLTETLSELERAGRTLSVSGRWVLVI